MRATSGLGFSPLTAAMRARSVGSIYSLYNEAAPAPLDDSFAYDEIDIADDLSDMGVDYDVPEDYDYALDMQDPDSGGMVVGAEEEEATMKRNLMIAGGIGAVVIIAGIAVVATRK